MCSLSSCSGQRTTTIPKQRSVSTSIRQSTHLRPQTSATLSTRCAVGSNDARLYSGLPRTLRGRPAPSLHLICRNHARFLVQPFAEMPSSLLFAQIVYMSLSSSWTSISASQTLRPSSAPSCESGITSGFIEVMSPNSRTRSRRR